MSALIVGYWLLTRGTPDAIHPPGIAYVRARRDLDPIMGSILQARLHRPIVVFYFGIWERCWLRLAPLTVRCQK